MGKDEIKMIVQHKDPVRFKNFNFELIRARSKEMNTMQYQDILDSIFSKSPVLDGTTINELNSKYTEIRKAIDDKLDYFVKLCVLNNYAQKNRLDIADQLTEYIDDYVYYKLCYLK